MKWEDVLLIGDMEATVTYALSEVNGKIPSVSFSPDGRFADNGALKVLYHEYVDCVNEGRAGGSGTYEVKDYSVIFNYPDGISDGLYFVCLFKMSLGD